MPTKKTSKADRIGADRPVEVDYGNIYNGDPLPRYDLRKPGSMEEAYAQHGQVFFEPGKTDAYYKDTSSAYTKPGTGEQVGGQAARDLYKGSQGESAGQDYWQGINGRYGDTAGPGYAQKAHQQFDRNVGGPGLDAYYDAAFSRTSRKLDRAAAARGQFNSSEALRNQRDAATSLDAEQANREADYNLRRQQAYMQSALGASGDELNWTQGLGQLAFNAGNEKLNYANSAANNASNVQQQEQNRLAAGYNAAMGLDQFNVASTVAGLGAAGDAQNFRQGRIQQQFDNKLSIGDRMSGLYGNALAADAAYAQQQLGMGMGGATDQYNINYANQQQNQARQDAMMQQFAQFMANYNNGQKGGR